MKTTPDLPIVPFKVHAICIIFAAMICAALLMATGACTPREKGEPPMFTGKIYSRDDIYRITGWERAIINKPYYAELNHDWIAWYQSKWRTEFSKGPFAPNQWTPEVLCTTFSTKFAADTQIMYFGRSFQSSVSVTAKGAAVIEYWYWTLHGDGHAIDAVITQRGLEFVEPQTLPGNNPFVVLDPVEKMNYRMAKAD